MLRMLSVLLRMVLSLKCLIINNFKDVKPFPRIYQILAPDQPPAFRQNAIATSLFSATVFIPFRLMARGKTVHFASCRCGRLCESAKANHNNIKLNPVFRGMLRENPRGFNQRKYCVKYWRKGIVGFRCPFWPPDEALEPQDEALHL